MSKSGPTKQIRISVNAYEKLMEIHRQRRAEHKVDKAVSWTVEAMIDLFETVEKTVTKGVIHSEKQSNYSADKKE